MILEIRYACSAAIETVGLCSMYAKNRGTIPPLQPACNLRPLSAHQLNAIRMALGWWAECGLLLFADWALVPVICFRPRATVHRVIHSTSGVTVLTVAQKGMK